MLLGNVVDTADRLLGDSVGGRGQAVVRRPAPVVGEERVMGIVRPHLWFDDQAARAARFYAEVILPPALAQLGPLKAAGRTVFALKEDQF